MTSAEILLFLGKPEFKRLDGPAQIWQYRQDICVLYMFLYPSYDGHAVSHIETLSHIDKHISQSKCFDNIVLAASKRVR